MSCRTSPAARRIVALSLASAAIPLCAQEPAAPPPAAASASPVQPATGDAPPPAAPPPANVEGRQSYTAADFARFAPKNALDMLRNVPGFQIRADQSGARGLGQATDNVIVNGQRLASKSDDLFSQLARIPAASVVRIDIVDGATLSIPGLSGQAADVITRPDTFSGQFAWRGEARAHYAHPAYTDAELSVKGTLGRLEYTVALNNDVGRGAFGGPYRILDGDGSLREARDGRLWSDYDSPKASVQLKHNGAGGGVANLNASYQRAYEDSNETETRVPVGGAPRLRVRDGRFRSYEYEIGGDYQFPLLGGSLKLIALNRFDEGRFSEQVVTTVSGTDASGGRYAQMVQAGEVIGRAEFGWKSGGADWQLATEAAFNRLDKEASLFDLAPGGGFIEVPFPAGDGGVREKRYEASVSYSRPLSAKLSLQATLAGERSTISQTGPGGAVRTFLRPKGSVSIAWAPQKGLDISLKVQRAVGQLNFGDFLGRVFLDAENQNDSNFELVPDQAWNIDLAAKKDLGALGNTNLRLFYRGVTDFVDLVPLPGGGEGRGNIPSVERYGFEWTSTFTLEPLGFKGGRLDTNVILQKSSLKDPLTGNPRQLANLTTSFVDVGLRHDVPGTDWAWGAGFEMSERQPYYRLNEIGLDVEGPVFDAYFIEHKDVLGAIVRFDVINLANARHVNYRTIYTGLRGSSPVAFIEDRDQLIGPIFRLSVRGNF
ncbi:TonB-dependent receptor plug domain-containing protein [Qipengyuania sediminis]|uniref:TonB-dependent receptor plug domain-containing protein n=1 Tax=Qipengyuania sediminis TaxID=1532023 RepID=UPI00105923F6|nr:TonB-dependent receptor plug domain-containing protein [Qipengyuania sediminis]